MRTAAAMLVIAVLATACKTTGSECRRYIRENNSCSQELGNSAQVDSLSADVVCATLNLPGIASEELRDQYACLADAYAEADCSSDEAFAETFDTTCDVDDTDDTD